MGASHLPLAAQQVTDAAQVTNAAPSPAPGPELPDAPGSVRYPVAEPVPAHDTGGLVTIESDDPQRHAGSISSADGHVIVTYGDRTAQADHIEYNGDTEDMVLTGHVLLTGGENQERIQASHGTLNLKAQTGRFYDVNGSVGVKFTADTTRPDTTARGRMIYTNNNPFLFTGRIVVKTGPKSYDVYDGTVTSCQLPKPDWLLSGAKFSVDDETARAKNSVFHLMSLPLLWLPYVTHAVHAQDRQSGFLVPQLPWYTSTKGFYAGEEVYWAINRSSDAILGTTYYSQRGWAESGTYRYRGLDQNMARAHFSALQDRGYTPQNGVYTNQGGQDVTFSGRRDFNWGKDAAPPESSDPDTQAPAQTGLQTGLQTGPQTRAVATVEYLSSFPYREAFSDSFNQAVSSDVISTVYGTHEWNGYAASVEGDRYQGEKRVASATLPEQQVHIFHAPSLEFASTEHRLGTTGLEWSVDSSAAGLKRIQPNFTTSGIIERLDVHPELAYPLSFGGWRTVPTVGARETFYSRSRFSAGTVAAPGTPPAVENTATLNRSDIEASVDLRPPVLERTFTSGFVKKLLRHDVRHTIEPELTYRYVGGIDNFQNILRFDAVDVASDTNELEYGVTQRLFLRQNQTNPCRTVAADDEPNTDGNGEDPDEDIAEPAGPELPVCGSRERITWRLSQKYFFDPTFGGAVGSGRRNILDTTLSFSGIAFLTEPRNISPLLSRLRIRTSDKTDVEWDFDYDTGAKRFTSNNVFLDVHQGNVFAGFSYARLNAPGRSYVEGVASAVSDFSQMRVLAGYGKPSKAGFSVAANALLDLNLGTVQYGAIETSYNWNCCGFSVEYRKYELGTTRNENAYGFNFTLANIGTAGNIRRAERLF